MGLWLRGREQGGGMTLCGCGPLWRNYLADVMTETNDA